MGFSNEINFREYSFWLISQICWFFFFASQTFAKVGKNRETFFGLYYTIWRSICLELELESFNPSLSLSTHRCFWNNRKFTTQIISDNQQIVRNHVGTKFRNIKNQLFEKRVLQFYCISSLHNSSMKGNFYFNTVKCNWVGAHVWL